MVRAKFSGFDDAWKQLYFDAYAQAKAAAGIQTVAEQAGAAKAQQAEQVQMTQAEGQAKVQGEMAKEQQKHANKMEETTLTSALKPEKAVPGAPFLEEKEVEEEYAVQPS